MRIALRLIVVSALSRSLPVDHYALRSEVGSPQAASDGIVCRLIASHSQ